MAKRHDENKDLISVSRIGRINYGDKTIKINKSSIVGIRLLGKLDYLTKYCGWYLVWDNTIFISTGRNNNDDNDKPKARVAKKANKQPKLSDKTNKKKK